MTRKDYNGLIINNKIQHMKQVSLGELSIEFKVNKSRLAYYCTMGLLKPIGNIGKTNAFDYDDVKKVLKKIDELQKEGKSIKEIKILLK